MCISLIVPDTSRAFQSRWLAAASRKGQHDASPFTFSAPIDHHKLPSLHLPLVPLMSTKDKMAALYTPTLTYDPITDPHGTQATHYQLERSPGDGFIYEAMADPMTGTATPFYHSDSLIIATAGKETRCLLI